MRLQVRSSHAANEGQVFSWANPPETGHPGSEPGCRCWAEPYTPPSAEDVPDDPPIEEVYPELLLPLLLPVGRIATAWRNWLLRRGESRSWQLSPYKSAITWGNRIQKGGWTPEKITEIIRRGSRVKVKNERTGGPATRYEDGDKYLVRDDKTGDILQLSGFNHIPKNTP